MGPVENIKCPFCLNLSVLKSEARSFNSSKLSKNVDIIVLFYICDSCGEQYTSTEADEINVRNFNSKVRSIIIY